MIRRKCSKCNQLKPLDDQHWHRGACKYKKHKDGYRQPCKSCANEYRREYKARKRQQQRVELGPRNKIGKRELSIEITYRRSLMLMAFNALLMGGEGISALGLRDVYHPHIRWAVKRGFIEMDGVIIKMSKTGIRYWYRISQVNAIRCNYPTYFQRVQNLLIESGAHKHPATAPRNGS